MVGVVEVHPRDQDVLHWAAPLLHHLLGSKEHGVAVPALQFGRLAGLVGELGGHLPEGSE